MSLAWQYSTMRMARTSPYASSTITRTMQISLVRKRYMHYQSIVNVTTIVVTELIECQ